MKEDDNSFVARVGSPLEKWNELKFVVQQENVKVFSEVAADFLDVLWCLDQYRVAGIPPPSMGKPGQADRPACGCPGLRMKGNWFSELVSLILMNQTASRLSASPGAECKAFRRLHQVDVAWPAARSAPLVCVETKVMGGPAYDGQRRRGRNQRLDESPQGAQVSGNRSEAYRREQRQRIDHWDPWRRWRHHRSTSLWCARMEQPQDSLDRMVAEVRALTETYLDGAAIFADRAASDGRSYTRWSISHGVSRCRPVGSHSQHSDEINDLASREVPA